MNLQQALRAAQPTGKLQRFKDTDAAGLYLRISSGGKRAYIVRAKGSTSDRKVGEPDSMTLDEARAAARALRPTPLSADGMPIAPIDFMARTAPSRKGRVAPSREPLETAPQSTTVLDAFGTYWEHCEARAKRGRMSAKTLKNYRTWYRRVIGAIGHLDMDVVVRHDIRQAVADMPAATHNGVLKLLNAFFNVMQVEYGMREARISPCKGVERDPEQWRKRTLTHEELGALSAVLERWARQRPAVVACIRFLLSSPRRISEALALRWEHVDLNEGRIYLPRTKMGESQVHALGAEALRVLKALPRKNAFVFASDDTRGHKRDAAISYAHVGKTWGEIRREAGCPDVRLHDLRRTVATWAAEGGATPHQLRAMLGHKTTAMADRYVGQVDEREPVNAATDAIAKAMRGDA